MLTDKKYYFPILSGNMLKLLAALFMVIDHVGVILFPECLILRVIGRLSYPIFAFMIAEGCFYTKNKIKYFLFIFLLGVLCQVVYFIIDNSLDMGILITFSISVILIYALEKFQKTLCKENFNIKFSIFYGLIFTSLVIADFLFCKCFDVDYGFWGTLAPVFVCAFRKEKGYKDNAHKLPIHIFAFLIGLLILSADLGGIQFYSLFSILFLLMYSGKRGERNMKYFFYIFYPVHFIILHLINILINF